MRNIMMFCLLKFTIEICDKVRLKAVISDVSLHDLRHTYATRAAEVGVSMPVIARLLGHSTIWTTSRYLRAAERSVRISRRDWRTGWLMRACQDVIFSNISEFQTAFDRIENMSAQTFCLRRTIFPATGFIVCLDNERSAG